jgi:hypothetical protein
MVASHLPLVKQRDADRWQFPSLSSNDLPFVMLTGQSPLVAIVARKIRHAEQTERRCLCKLVR